MGVTLEKVEVRLLMIAEGDRWRPEYDADQALESIGFARNGELTEAGIAYHTARLVARNKDTTSTVLGDLLRKNVIANTFCGSLWPHQKVPGVGAIRLLKRLTAGMVPKEVSADDWLFTKAHDDFAKLWLDLMNLAGLVVYDSKNDDVRILYNPNELAPQEDEAQRERSRGHLIEAKNPYGNLLALKEMIGGARKSIRWYEQHMPAKVLEVLYREIDGQKVASIRLLSGPANVATKDEFRRFREEMASERQVEVQWRVLTKEEARVRHGRFFITEGFSRNLPPLNAILEGSVDEILPSDMVKERFDESWELGLDLDRYPPPAK